MILFLALLAESQSSLWDGAPPGVCPSVRPSVYVLKQFGFCEITQTNLDGFQGNLEHEFMGHFTETLQIGYWVCWKHKVLCYDIYQLYSTEGTCTLCKTITAELNIKHKYSGRNKVK